MNKFDENKLYIFSKEKYRVFNGKITELAELLNNRIVNVENKYIGTITVDNEEYIIFPYNCNEISIEVYSTKEGNVYNEHVEDEQDNSNETYMLKEGFISMDDPITSFLDRLVAMGLDESEEKEEREDDRLNKFDLNKKYIFDKNLISDDIVVGDWVDRINGREIDVKSYSLGYIYDEESDFNYFISPRWCRELKEDE